MGDGNERDSLLAIRGHLCEAIAWRCGFIAAVALLVIAAICPEALCQNTQPGVDEVAGAPGAECRAQLDSAADEAGRLKEQLVDRDGQISAKDDEISRLKATVQAQAQQLDTTSDDLAQKTLELQAARIELDESYGRIGELTRKKIDVSAELDTAIKKVAANDAAYREALAGYEAEKQKTKKDQDKIRDAQRQLELQAAAYKQAKDEKERLLADYKTAKIELANAAISAVDSSRNEQRAASEAKAVIEKAKQQQRALLTAVGMVFTFACFVVLVICYFIVKFKKRREVQDERTWARLMVDRNDPIAEAIGHQFFKYKLLLDAAPGILAMFAGLSAVALGLVVAVAVCGSERGVSGLIEIFETTGWKSIAGLMTPMGVIATVYGLMDKRFHELVVLMKEMKIITTRGDADAHGEEPERAR